MKLTASQVGAKLNVASYTIKRWYEFYNDLDKDEISALNKEGMPLLPKYELAGNRGDRLWDEEDIPILEQFKNWMPFKRTAIKNIEKEN